MAAVPSSYSCSEGLVAHPTVHKDGPRQVGDRAEIQQQQFPHPDSAFWNRVLAAAAKDAVMREFRTL